ncbi:MAG TPA: Rid family detoxifying hydrolase [Blastocatellia bacterium]|nr:Rid family detoxifying hydrolase [Blastocatellia bacterium]
MTRRRFIKTSGATALGAAALKAGESPAPAQQGKPSPPKTNTRRQEVTTELAPKPVGPYSQAMVAGDMIYVAGQGPFNPKTGVIAGQGIAEQTEQTLANIKAILKAAGATLSDVVKVNVYLTDLGDFAKMNEVYSRYFKGERDGAFPARATIGAKLLANMLIEVECVAIKPKR